MNNVNKRLSIYVLKEKEDSENNWNIAGLAIYRSEAKDWKSEHSPRWNRYRDFEVKYLDIPEHVYNEADRSPE